MAEEILELTMREGDRLKIIWQVLSRKLAVRQAKEQLGLSKRQVLRLCKRVKREGNKGVIHRLRGKPSNHRLAEGMLQRAVQIVSTRYADFGPTFANEQLRKEHGIFISTNSLRNGMISEGLWLGRKRKAKHRKYRDRKECPGELVQLDGSIHRWFEDRGEKCVLVTYVDDATSRILHAEFVVAEDTISLLQTTKNYLQKCGRPLSFYVDKDSIYRINRQPTIEEQLRDREPMTQFARAMEELGIDVNFAHSPQAKGRVERGFKTHQDRLVKELRLNGISDLQQANVYLENVYVPAHNSRFTVKAANPTDAHRQLLKEHRLDEILSVRTVRTLANDFTIRFLNSFFQLLPNKKVHLRPKAKITVEIQLDGSLHLKHRGSYLPYTSVEKAQPTATEHVPIGKGNHGNHPKPAPNHPWHSFVHSQKYFQLGSK